MARAKKAAKAEEELAGIDAENVEYQAVPIDDLVQMTEGQNPVTHGEENHAQVKASIEEHGQVETVLVQKGTNLVIAGNLRVEVMRELGYKSVRCLVYDCDDDEAKQLAARLNRTGELHGWNRDVLFKLAGKFGEAEIGWSASALAGLKAKLKKPRKKAAQGDQVVKPKLRKQKVEYTIAFDDADQQAVFFKFLRRLKASFPGEESQAARIMRALGDAGLLES